MERHRKRVRRRIALALATAVILVGGYFGLVWVLRALPPRYVAMLPEPFQQMGQIPHPDLLPTPAGVVRRTGLQPWPTITPPVTPTAIPSLTATSSPQNKETHTPTPPAIPTALPTIPPTPTQVPLAPSAQLHGFRFNYQTWNNCGPATITMDLSFYGWGGDQAQAASFLKPDKEDKNVSPNEMAAFAQSLGLQAEYRVNGTLGRIKRFLMAGIPVIVETGYDPEPQRLGWMGHYRLVIGYDDNAGQFMALDSYKGAGDKGNGLADPYGDFDTYWRQFNRTYLVVYTRDQAAEVQALLGSDTDDSAMYTAALSRAQAEAAANPQDAFAWFNAGSSLVGLGRYDEAAAAYDQARLIGLPWRMLWYQFGPYEAYYQVRRYNDILNLAAALLQPAPNLEESLYYQGLAEQALGQADAARASFQAALRYNPNFNLARQALAQVGGAQ